MTFLSEITIGVLFSIVLFIDGTVQNSERLYGAETSYLYLEWAFGLLYCFVYRRSVQRSTTSNSACRNFYNWPICIPNGHMIYCISLYCLQSNTKLYKLLHLTLSYLECAYDRTLLCLIHLMGLNENISVPVVCQCFHCKNIFCSNSNDRTILGMIYQLWKISASWRIDVSLWMK